MQMDRPEAKIVITDNLVKVTRNFIKDVAGFREMMVRRCVVFCAVPLCLMIVCFASLCLPGMLACVLLRLFPAEPTLVVSVCLCLCTCRSSARKRLLRHLRVAAAALPPPAHPPLVRTSLAAAAVSFGCTVGAPNGCCAAAWEMFNRPRAALPCSAVPASPGGFLAMMGSENVESGVTALAPAKQEQQQPGVAAEAARQQALLRQRQLQAAAAEQQRRREAAAAAALPADAQQRLLAVMGQARGQEEAAAVQNGFQRLQKVLQAAEQRQLATQAQPISTPPLPAEALRLIAQDTAALEEAAAGALASARVSSAVLTAATGHGYVLGEQQQCAALPAAAAPAAEQPDTKRQRSSSPEEGAGQAAQRQKSALERRLAAECQTLAAACMGDLLLHVGPDGTDANTAALVTCLPRAAQAAASTGANTKQQWQALLLRVPAAYPQESPTAVFPRSGSSSSGGEAGAAKAALQQQLADACRARFAERMAAAPQPCRLQQIAEAWLEATKHVSMRLSSRQLEEQQ